MGFIRVDPDPTSSEPNLGRSDVGIQLELVSRGNLLGLVSIGAEHSFTDRIDRRTRSEERRVGKEC